MERPQLTRLHRVRLAFNHQFYSIQLMLLWDGNYIALFNRAATRTDPTYPEFVTHQQEVFARCFIGSNGCVTIQKTPFLYLKTSILGQHQPGKFLF